VFLFAEVIGGVAFNSVALLSDAAHMLMDVGALALALVAAEFAARPASNRRTYGFGRVETLAALFNAATLIGASVWIIYEATNRLINPVIVDGGGVAVIAFLGLVANGAATWLLTRADRTNINVRAAMMHSLMDALSSVGVLIAGGVIALTGFAAIDPLASYLIAALSIAGTVGIVKSATNSLLDAAPDTKDAAHVGAALAQHPMVTQAHDVHVWTIGTNQHAATAHVLVRPDQDIGDMIEELSGLLRTNVGLQHVTLQVAHDRSLRPVRFADRLQHPRKTRLAPPPDHARSAPAAPAAHGHAHVH